MYRQRYEQFGLDNSINTYHLRSNQEMCSKELDEAEIRYLRAHFFQPLFHDLLTGSLVLNA
jgi:hypothetical protein